MARAVNTNRVFEDYDPPSELATEEGCDTILIYLPGYRKDQLRVQLTTSRILRISGERQVGDNKWRRFNKEFRVPANCDTKEITAKFEAGILYIRQPKLITPAAPPTAEAQVEAPKSSPPTPQAPEIPHPPQQPQPQKLPPLQPQTQQHAPLHEPQNDMVGKPDTYKKEEEGKGKYELKPRSTTREMVGRRGFFSEMSKPENCKRLVIAVLVVLSIGFYSSYMFKSFMEDGREL